MISVSERYAPTRTFYRLDGLCSNAQTRNWKSVQLKTPCNSRSEVDNEHRPWKDYDLPLQARVSHLNLLCSNWRMDSHHYSLDQNRIMEPNPPTLNPDENLRILTLSETFDPL